MSKNNQSAVIRRKRSNERYFQKQLSLISNLSLEDRQEFEQHQQVMFSKEPILANEYWMPIINWDMLYEISNFGRIKGLISKKIKTPHLHHSGYYTMPLQYNYKPKYYILSRLLAINFIDNPHNLPEVNHINKIRIDCRLNNLEWTTPAQNALHKMTNNCSYDNRRGIIQYGMNGEFIKEWDSISDAAKFLGKCGGNISSVCQGKNHYMYGYRWRYKT